MTDWKPTHRITLTDEDGGESRTEQEWNECVTAAWEVDDGEWLFNGQPTPHPKLTVSVEVLPRATETEDIHDAKVYARAVIDDAPRTELFEVVLAAICAWDTLFKKTDAARVGVAMAVAEWVEDR